MSTHFDAKAKEIQGCFIAKASGQQARLHAILAQLDGPPSTETLDELHQISHWLAGSAATFGFRAISEAADAVESEIISQRSSGVADGTALNVLCNRLLSSIQASIPADAPAADPVADNG